MRRTLNYPIVWLSALLVCVVIPQALRAQSNVHGVFSDMQTTVAPRPSSALEQSTLRTRVVQVDTQKINAARRGREILKLNLFDDAVVEVQIESVRPTSSGYFISGNPKGMEWGKVRLVVNGPVMVGTVVTPEGKFTIRSGGSGRHVIRQIDPSAVPFECGVEDGPLPAVPPQPSRSVNVISSNDSLQGGAFSQTALEAADMPTEDGSVVRVLVVYTPAMQAQEGGAAGMKALVDLYVQSANQAFEDSGINPRLVLAHSAMVDYVAGDTSTDKSRLEDPDDGYMDEVHVLRNQYAADLVHLVKTVTGGYAGLATPLFSESLRGASLGFAVTATDEFVFTHEIGHNFGMAHDRFNETADNKIYPYAFGYENKRALEPGSPVTSHWYTIMAYPNRCGRAGIFCEQLLRFSNPDQSFRGDPLGVSADSSETGLNGPADARLTINNTARWVGSFRSEACTDFTVLPQTPVVSVDGGQIRKIVSVDAGYGCVWDVASQSEFLTVISPSRAAGEGFVSIEVEANRSGVERNGVLTVAGTNISVRQLATDEGICSRTAAVHSAIKRALGLTCDKVSDNDLVKVQTLELSDQGLSSLKAEDFQGLTGLTHLRLDSNKLTGLPANIFTDLTSLESVDLSDNLLTEVPEGLFSGLVSLESVDLSDNLLTNAPDGLFANLSSLVSIDINGNPLTELQVGIFEGLTILKHIGLEDTRITRLRVGLFSDLSNLESLNLGGLLVELPAGVFVGLSSLNRLDLAANQLTSLPLGVFDGLSSLYSLSIGGSRISSLPLGVFDGLSSLNLLSIGGTGVTSLPVGMFKELSNLKILHLTHNDRLTELPQGLFAGLSHLYFLGLQLNDLSNLPVGLFAGLTALGELYLTQNDLTTLPDGLFLGLPALKRLHLDRNSLSSLRAGVFSGPGGLQHLDLSFNELSILPDGIFSSLTELKTLSLEHNKVFPIPFPLSLEKVADSQFKAVAPAGAPFALVLPVSVSSGGEIEGDAVTITIAAGTTESTPLGLTRAAGMEGAVNVDISSLPGLPGDHSGYILTKEESLPRVILESQLPDDAMLIDISVSEAGIQPVFSTDTRNYEAIVANGVSSLSVITMTSNPGATVTFLDESDSALEDTDGTREGHQLNLGVGENIITLKVTSEDGSATEEYTLTVIRDGATNVCTRTTQVKEAIVAELQGTACSEITDSQLSSIAGTIRLSGKDIFSLQSGDFKGLTSLRHLFINNNPLSSLPSGVFSGLTNLNSLLLINNHLISLTSDVFAGLTTLESLAFYGNHLSSLPSDVFAELTTLRSLHLSDNHLSGLPSNMFAGLTALKILSLSENHLSSVPADMFAGLTALEVLYLNRNPLSSLPSDVFAGLIALKELDLRYNQLSSLPADVFAGLTALEELDLRYNRLSSLPPGVFTGLNALEELIIEGNHLNSLPSDMFSGLPSLRYLELSENLLSSLPSGIFSGLTGLEYLALRDNIVDPLPLPVSLEKVGDSQFKGVAPTGMPFSIEVAVSTSSSGAIDGGAGAVSIPAGAVESTPLGVSRKAGTEDAVTVDTGDLPAVPDNFYGIILERDETLPREILSGPKALPPGQVTGLEVTLGVEQLDVSWTAVTDADGYTVQWKSVDLDYDESRQAIIAGGDTLSHTIADLMAGTEYTVRVFATRDNADDGPPSSEVIGIPKSPLPAGVTGVEIAAGIDQLDVSWTAVPDADGYTVQWKSGDLDYDESRQAIIAGGDTLSHTIADLTAGTEYTVRVFATRDNADDGPPSGEVTGIPKFPSPAQVTGVEIAAGIDQLDVSWTAVSDADGYTVQWKSGDLDYGESHQAVIAGGDLLSHTIADLMADTEYTVRVFATRVNADNGPSSNEVTGMPKFPPPARVTGVAIAAGINELDVSWTAVPDADGYTVQWKLGDLDYGESRQAVIAGGDTLSHTIADLMADTEYTVRVFATRVNADNGPPSSEVTGTPISVNPDVNGDGILNGDDALVMYHAYESSDQVGDGETGGTATSRQTLLSGLAGKPSPSDDDLKDMIRKANVWREVGVDADGDINEDGEINESVLPTP